MSFRFQQFIVEDDRSTMPVGTDAMLLGAWADPGNAGRILDIGTGCGVIALMMAQKCQAPVDAIDRDSDSAAEAALNFKNSPWPDRLMARCITLKTFSETHQGKYGFIVCNPPYFFDSLQSPSPKRNLARHLQDFRGRDLILYIQNLLEPEGCFAVVLPYDAEDDFSRTAVEVGFFIKTRMSVKSFLHKKPVRTLTCFSKSETISQEKQELIIFDAPGKFSAGYLKLTTGFHYFDHA